MRLLLFFDLPTKTKQDLREYRSFVKYLKNDGYLRVQYSVYAKLCINKDSAKQQQIGLKRMLQSKEIFALWS